MPVSVAQSAEARPVLRPDERARMAKASVRKADNPHAETGELVAAVRELSKLNLDEFAQAIKKDPRQVKRWEEGTDRPQLEALIAVERFKPLLTIALAQRSGQHVQIETTIRIKRSA